MYGQAAQTAIVSEETDFRKPDVFSSSLEIREVGAKGKGVFAAETFAKGRVVIVGKPVYRTPKRTWQTLQVGIDAQGNASTAPHASWNARSRRSIPRTSYLINGRRRSSSTQLRRWSSSKAGPSRSRSVKTRCPGPKSVDASWVIIERNHTHSEETDHVRRNL